MKNTKLISLIVSICLSLHGFAREGLSPVRGFITELALESAPKTLNHLQAGIENPQKILYKTEDKELTQKVFSELKKQKATITYQDKFFTVKVADLEIKITLVDFISRTYSINGHPYIFSEEKALRAHIESISQIIEKKVVYNNPFIEEAHAFLPLLFIIPAIIAGSAAAVTIDGIMSNTVNDLKNMDAKTVAKIDKLTKKYKERANTCESDLENAKSSNSKGHISKLTSVRAIGELHKVLNTELYNKWFNGKSQIDYNKLGCSRVASKNDISSGSVTGLFRGAGKILGKLCKEQDRLNTCFASTEDIMRDQGIQIHELRSPDKQGPYKDLYQEYKEISNTVGK